ncbi:MAG: hypothetical protein REJ50_01135 [Bordetella sp.]|nr:hypothetical protein [Bordetella sp.]
MVRSILGVQAPQTAAKTELRLDSAPRAKLAGAQLKSRLRQKRSGAYVTAMTQLDAGGHVHSPAATQAFMDTLRAEFPDVQVDAWPLGIIAKCFLGEPHEVHTLDCTGAIIRHFKRGEALPDGMSRARSLAASGHYAFIEVFTDKLIAVSPSGETAIIES